MSILILTVSVMSLSCSACVKSSLRGVGGVVVQRVITRVYSLAALLRHLLGKPCRAKHYWIDCNTQLLLPTLSNGESLVLQTAVAPEGTKQH